MAGQTSPLDSSFFQKLTDATPAMIAVYNIQTGEYIYVNGSIKKLLGYSAKELLNGGFPFISALVHPEDAPRITEQNLAALKKANAQKTKSYTDELIAQFEYRMRHKKGHWVWLKTDGSVFERDEKGKVLCVLNISIDITERKVAEEKLYALANTLEEKVKERTEELSLSKERYQKLLDTISEGVWLSDMHKNGVENTGWWFKVTGQTKEESNAKKGLGWLDVVHPDDRARVKKTWADAFRSGNYYETFFRIHTKDDKYRTIAAKGIPIKKKNKVVEWIGTFHDITEKIKAREEQERAANVLNKMAEAFVSLDSKLRFIYVNKKAETFINRKSDEIVGKTLEEIFPKAVFAPLYKQIKLLLKNKKPVETEFFSVILQRWIGVRMYRTDLGISAYFNDITERKKLESLKEEFIAIAAHELRTPVTSLKAYNQVLKYRFEKTKDESAKQSVEKMDVQLTKLTSLINDLLDVSKIESGRLKFDKAHFYIDSLINEVVDDVQLTTKDHKIVIEGKVGKKVFANYDRVSQVLVNLLSNAIKYSPDRKKIIVRASRKNGTACVSVTDFGQGVPEKHRPRIFERFYRVDGPKHSTYPGLGLGLYISSEIIKHMGGDISLESNKGKGSTFLFTLPLAKK